jgi:uncharacterized protein (TIGR03083 family)
MTAGTARPDEYLHWFAAERAAFRQVLETGELDAPVPGCPGWDLAALTAHLGGIHRWARLAVLTGPDSGEYPAPEGREALVHWFEEGAAALEHVLRDTEPEKPCWTIAPPATAAFWIRRQAQETAIHRWDAQSSQGQPEPLDPALAADGVAEVVDMFYPRQVRLGRQAPLTHSLRIEVTGGPTHTLAERPNLSTELVDATITGPAEALLLLLWKRTSLEDARLRLSGSAAAAREILGAHITP